MAKEFNFETYTINTLDAINKKLDGLATTFMPREETNLRFSEILKAQTSLAQTLAEHTTLIANLKSVDDRQQGSIDTSRRMTNLGLTALGVAATFLFIYVTWKVSGSTLR